MIFKRLWLGSLALVLCVSCKEQPTAPPPVEDSNNKEKTLPMAQLELEMNSQLGEGAFWDTETQELYWVDILGMKLHIYDPHNKTDRTFQLPSRVGTVVPQTDSTVVVALEDGIYLQNTKSGSLKQLSNIEADLPGNRFNDGKCDPNGNLWVGSMHLAEKEPVAKLYKVNAKGETETMLDNITISNGIVWTKDAKTMYYIDTPTGKIRAFDYDKSKATISNERVAVVVPDSLGFPDGMAIDAEDKLWMGMWNGNAVIRFDPITGTVMSKIEVPAHNVTSCAFGGPNLDELYITTATVDMTEEEKVQYPLAGSLFKVKPGVKGVPSPLFATE